MMISTKLQALRQLFTLHARVAILPSANEVDSNVSEEQNFLAHRYAQAYRQSYQSILWLDASNPALLRLSCLHACANLGLASELDPCLQIQQWLRQQSDSLLIIEHVRSPQLLSAFSRHAQHVLICSPLQRWPARAPRSALLRLHGEPQLCNVRPADANWAQMAQQIQQLAQLSPAAQTMLATVMQLAPLPLPLALFSDSEHSAAKAELSRNKILVSKRWRDEFDNLWPCVSVAKPYYDSVGLAILGDAQTDAILHLPTAQEDCLLHTLSCLRTSLTHIEQAKPLRRLWRQHIDYFLAHQPCPARAAAQLLLLLEALYQDQPKTAEVLLRQALHLLEDKAPAPSAESLHCRNLLAQNLKQQGRLDEAQVWLVESLQLARHKDGEETRACCFLLSNLARLFAQRGQHLAALELEQQALQLLRQRLSDADPHVQAVMQNLAHSLQQVAADEKSQSLLHELVILHVRLFGEDDQRSQALMDQLAGNLFQQHKILDAAYWMGRVLKARRHLYGAHHVETSIAAYELMCLHCESEDG
ncbi:MAG: tetratricopeptide repeat protein, partial [Burkholderiales bacterium]|nr:tetratricopeptide repeat protein [Burkholderiales bacterium]